MKKLKIATASLILALAVATPGLAQNPGSARAQQAKLNAQERVQLIKEKAVERRAQLKTDFCERRQDRLNNAITRLNQRSVRLKSVIDTMFVRVRGFYDSGQLTVENYDELKTEIETAQADAEAAISALETFTVVIDCDNVQAGEQLDSFRTAVQETRSALKAYRKALVELISALNNAAGKTDQESDDDNGGEQ